MQSPTPPPEPQEDPAVYMYKTVTKESSAGDWDLVSVSEHPTHLAVALRTLAKGSMRKIHMVR